MAQTTYGAAKNQPGKSPVANTPANSATGTGQLTGSGQLTGTKQSTGSGQNSATDQAKQKAADASQSLKDKATEAQGELKHQAAEATEAVKRKVSEAQQQAKAATRQYADDKKTRLADEIGVFSGAIRKAAGKLHDEEHDSIACYVDAAAEQLDDMRDALKSKDLSELLHDAQDLARRHPEIVYGGLFVAGLAAVRFLKASKPRREPGRNLSNHNERPTQAFGHIPQRDVTRPPVGARSAQQFAQPQGDQA